MTSVCVFTQVFSVPGSYLTARARNGAVTSVLTRDMGQTWSPLAPATEVCEDNPGCQVVALLFSFFALFRCSWPMIIMMAQVHLFFAPDTRLGAVQSVPAALGVIMGVGHEGYTVPFLRLVRVCLLTPSPLTAECAVREPQHIRDGVGRPAVGADARGRACARHCGLGW